MISEKSVTMEDLMVGMTVASDVTSKTGEIIVKKGTVLDIISLNRLKTFYINRIREENYASTTTQIYEEYEVNSDYLKYEDDDEFPSLKKDDKQVFADFKNIYSEVQAHTKQYLKQLEDGKPVVITDLYDMTKKIISNIKPKSNIFTYLNYLKDLDDYSYTHSVNVSILGNIFGHWLELSEDEIVILTSAGMLIDIGKGKISQDILNKNSKLTDLEFEEIKKHVIYGYNILINQQISEDIKLAVLQHHERIDGSGYPNGLTDFEINRYAKMIAILDVYEAMISVRPYRDKISPFEVIREFERNYFGKMDTKYLMVFLKNIAYNYLGRKIRLSDGRLGEVVFINSNIYSAPIVKLYDNTYIDLSREANLKIEAVL